MRFLKLVFFLLCVLNAVLLGTVLYQAAGGRLFGEDDREPERLGNQVNPDRIRVLPVPPLIADLSSAATTAALSSTEAQSVWQVVGAAPVAVAVSSRAVSDSSSSAASNVSSGASSSTSSAAASGMSSRAVASSTASKAASSRLSSSASSSVGARNHCVAFRRLTDEQAQIVRLRMRQEGSAVFMREISTPGKSERWWVNIPPQDGKDGAQSRVSLLKGMGINDVFIVQKAGDTQYTISLGIFGTEAAARRHMQDLQAKGVTGMRVTAQGERGMMRIELTGAGELLDGISRDLSTKITDVKPIRCQPG